MSALLRVSKHMENTINPDPETGVPHYPERNWEQGMPMHVMMDSAIRHIFKYMAGWDDEDHLCAATTNLLMAMWTEDNIPNMQDIPSRMALFAPPLTSDESDGRTYVEENEGQEKPNGDTGRHMSECAYYTCYGECLGQKGMPECPFEGDRGQCRLEDD